MPYGMFGEKPPEPEEEAGDGVNNDGAKSTKSTTASSGSLMHSMGVNASMRGVSGRDASLAGTMKVSFVSPDLKPCFETLTL